MILGAALNPFSEESLPSQVEAYAEGGFPYVDLAFDHPLDFRNFDAARFRALLEKNKLGFFGQTPVLLPFGSPYPDIREKAVQTALSVIDSLGAAGARHFVLHPDNAYGFLPAEKLIQWNVDSFTQVHQARPEVQLLFENLHSGIFNQTRNLEALLDAVPGSKAIIDIAHVFLAERKKGSTLDEWLTLPVGHMHWSENDGATDMHAWLGGTALPWKENIGKIRKTYDKTATIEIYRGLTRDTLAAKKFLEPLLPS